MASNAGQGTERRRSRWRIAGWGVAALVLLAPLVAMQFTREVVWTASDFVFAGLLVGGIGGAFELAVRMSPDRSYRAAVGFALAATFLTIWVNAAVGMIRDEGDPLNLMFAGVLGIALLGSLLVRFRAGGLARVMMAAAVAQLAAGAVGTLFDPRGGMLSAGFAILWLLSAAMFRKAARVQPMRSVI